MTCVCHGLPAWLATTTIRKSKTHVTVAVQAGRPVDGRALIKQKGFIFQNSWGTVNSLVSRHPKVPGYGWILVSLRKSSAALFIMATRRKLP